MGGRFVFVLDHCARSEDNCEYQGRTDPEVNPTIPFMDVHGEISFLCKPKTPPCPITILLKNCYFVKFNSFTFQVWTTTMGWWDKVL